MVFSSVPPYIDHHHPNWHQVQLPNHQQASLSQSPQLQPPPPLPPLPPQVDGSGGGGIRPGSMVDRARLAKVPQPEAGLNCPRCDSTNTKFCYFNNYSLTQPRHFCKACRRYWTRGGALRNVPVGGGYRKNKRSKNTSGSSKSQVTGPSKSTSVSPSPSGTDASGHFPFMGTFQNLAQYGGGNVGPNLAEFQAQMAAAGGGGQADLGLQMGGTGGVEQQYWRFPFLGSFDTPTNFHQYQNQVKMEENQGLNLSKQFMGFSENSQYWGGNLFSGVNSSSTSSLL